jgi:hypothetical protein
MPLNLLFNISAFTEILKHPVTPVKWLAVSQIDENGTLHQGQEGFYTKIRKVLPFATMPGTGPIVVKADQGQQRCFSYFLQHSPLEKHHRIQIPIFPSLIFSKS